MKFQANSAKFTMNGNNSNSGKSPTIFFSFWLFDIKNAVIFPFLKTWEEKEIDVGETFHYNRADSAQLKHRWAGKEKVKSTSITLKSYVVVYLCLQTW